MAPARVEVLTLFFFALLRAPSALDQPWTNLSKRISITFRHHLYDQDCPFRFESNGGESFRAGDSIRSSWVEWVGLHVFHDAQRE